MANSKFKEPVIATSNGALMAENEFRCVICSQFLREPVLTRCGHRFCCECLTMWLREKKKKECPLDSNELDLEKDTFPDNYTKRQIAEFVCRCTNEGCFIEVPMVEYDDHLSSCKYQENKFKTYGDSNNENSVQQNCMYENIGCFFKGTLETITEHMKSDVCAHSQLLLKQVDQLKNKEKCHNCASCTCNGKSVENENNLPFYLNDVYEKLIELDQRSRECFIKLNNMTLQLNHCVSEVAFRKLNSPEMNNGLLTWRLCNFDEMELRMNKDPATTFYSPVFSTNELGYRFRIRLTMSKTNSEALALILHMVKGNYDSSLKWPFVGEISLNILNQMDSDLRINALVKTDRFSAAFQRPTQDINVCGFGFLETMSILCLRDKGFIYGNELTIVVSVRSYDGM